MRLSSHAANLKDTSIKAMHHEMAVLRQKSAQDDCYIAQLKTSNEGMEREIEHMTSWMKQEHDERMAQGKQTMANTMIFNYNAPVFCNGGTMAGNVNY